jgi:hypothetical protein
VNNELRGDQSPGSAQPVERLRSKSPDPIPHGTGALKAGGFKEGKAAHRLGCIQAAAHEVLKALGGLVSIKASSRCRNSGSAR